MASRVLRCYCKPLVRPPVRSNGRSSVLPVMFFFFFIFLPRVLRVPSTDRPETLPPDRNLRVFYNASPKIRGPSPKKLYPLKNFGRFWTLQTLIANISGTALDIQNRPALQTMAIPPAFNETRSVNFGPLTARNYM